MEDADQAMQMPLNLLQEITNGLSEERIIGQGSRAVVYLGVQKNGEKIAVKMLRHSIEFGDKQFHSEAKNHMRIKHQNIVQFVGYCNETQLKNVQLRRRRILDQKLYQALCSEYMSNGRLEDHISDENVGLDWHTRYKIIKGISEGLEYLHEGTEGPIYHLGVDLSNILLDRKMVPKLAGFGASSSFGVEQTKIIEHRDIGALVYWPPEYIQRKIVSVKFDIFSLGVVIIKIITGHEGYSRIADMSPQQFVELVHDNWRNRLEGDSVASLEACCQQVKTCIEIALSCVENDRHKRPTIGDIIHQLNKTETTIDEVAPFSSELGPPVDQVVKRFQELFSQRKYKEAAELAVEFPQELLRTPENVVKFKTAPLQFGQVSPLQQYFATLLARGKLNAYESLELSRLAINQNGKNLLEGWLADDKLECSEELGNLVKTVDDDLALKIYIKARENPRVVAALNERREFDSIFINPELSKKARTLEDPAEINYKVYNGEGSIFSSYITPGPSSEMADLASEIEALERILSDASAQATRLSYALMKSVTNNFSKVIGCGGFAVVYQGYLRNGKVAVKKLSTSNGFSDELFVDEIECLMKAKHNNVVRYLGYCADTHGELMEFNGRYVIAEVPKRLLCFEYVPNGSLHRYLKGKPCGDEWQVRYKIIKGICQGLQYLHKIRINHLDLKPGNILLDDGMEPKISDFGLSRCFDEEQSRVFTKHIGGTRGYIAPETINSGEISFESDIFSLGIIIIKLLTGHIDYDIENWHKSLNTDCPQVRRCIEIAQACVDHDQHKRPAISEIIHKLDELETVVDSPVIN